MKNCRKVIKKFIEFRKKKIDGVEHAFVKWSGYSDKYNQ
jgi:hypothetical protein